MKNSILLLFALFSMVFAQAQYTSWLTGDAGNSNAQPEPGIVLMGGASEHDEAMKWFLQQANGGDVVVIRASGSDGYNDYLFSDLGVEVNSVETIRFDNSSASQNPYVIDQLLNAEAIWIAGGDQYDYVTFWQGTAVEDAINNLINNIGGPVGGTSAGMAILCGRYFSAQEGTITSAEALADPFSEEVTLGNNDFLEVPFLDEVVTDTHYNDPDRRGRHVAFLSRLFGDTQGLAKGIACDEYTAITIDELGLATVWGDTPDYFEYIYFIQSNCETLGPEVLSSETPLTWNQNESALSVYKIRGDNEGSNTFDLTDWTTGVGGEWLYWYTIDGELFEVDGAAPDCATSINEKDQGSIRVFPNPASASFNVSLVSASDLIVYNSFGQLVYESSQVQLESQVSTKGWSKGVYYLHAGSEKRTIIID